MAFLINALLLGAMVALLVVMYRENNRVGPDYSETGPWFAKVWTDERMRVAWLLLVFAIGIGLTVWMVATTVDAGLRVHEPAMLRVAAVTAGFAAACLLVSLLLARVLGRGADSP